MKIAIIAAMDEELTLLLAQLENKQTSQYYGFDFHTGTLAGKEVILVKSKIGKVSAAVAVTLLQQIFSPDYVINTGSAGCLANNLTTGDIVIGNAVSYYDVDVTAFDYAYGQVPQMPAKFLADQQLLMALEQAKQAETQIKIEQGLIVSGDSFVNSAEQVTAIKKHFPDALALEMEAGGIAQACFLLEIPFAIVRAVSDSADDDAKLTHEEFLELAGEHSAKLVTLAVKNL